MGLSSVGYLAVYPSAYTPYGGWIPLLGGSGWNSGRGHRIWEPSSPVAPITHTTSVLRAPVIRVVTHAYDDFWSAESWSSMFAPTDQGQIPTLGRVQIQFAGDSPVHYAACKVDTLSVAWSDSGEAILLTFDLYPYGGTLPATGAPVFNARPMGRPWHSKGVSYGGSLSGVAAGQIVMSNRLTPDRSFPRFASYDGNVYPPYYKNDTLAASLTLWQYAGEFGVVSSLDDSDRGFVNILFANPDNSRRIRARTRIAPPNEDATVHLGQIGVIKREYPCVAPDGASPIVTVSSF